MSSLNCETFKIKKASATKKNNNKIQLQYNYWTGFFLDIVTLRNKITKICKKNSQSTSKVHASWWHPRINPCWGGFINSSWRLVSQFDAPVFLLQPITCFLSGGMLVRKSSSTTLFRWNLSLLICRRAFPSLFVAISSWNRFVKWFEFSTRISTGATSFWGFCRVGRGALFARGHISTLTYAIDLKFVTKVVLDKVLERTYSNRVGYHGCMLPSLKIEKNSNKMRYSILFRYSKRRKVHL